LSSSESDGARLRSRSRYGAAKARGV